MNDDHRVNDHRPDVWDLGRVDAQPWPTGGNAPRRRPHSRRALSRWDRWMIKLARFLR